MAGSCKYLPYVFCGRSCTLLARKLSQAGDMLCILLCMVCNIGLERATGLRIPGPGVSCRMEVKQPSRREVVLRLVTSGAWPAPCTCLRCLTHAGVSLQVLPVSLGLLPGSGHTGHTLWAAWELKRCSQGTPAWHSLYIRLEEEPTLSHVLHMVPAVAAAAVRQHSAC